MNIHSIFGVLFRLFRRGRMRDFLRTFTPNPNQTSILDVGGYPEIWKLCGYRGKVTLLNVHAVKAAAEDRAAFHFVQGDGRRLQYADNSFDIVFSNSVIEHVGDYDQQKQFAAEVCRVGVNLWIQTPARSFILEPHYITPFIHWFPDNWQRRLARNFTLWGWITRPSPKQVDTKVDGIRLLTYREMVEFFPGCEIRKERFLGMTKSYIAVCNAPQSGH